MKLSNFILISSSNSILNPKVVYSFHLLFAIFIMQGCRKEYPCPTCFESIITCKVNGKEWKSNCVSNDPLFGCRAVSCYYYYNSDFSLDFFAGNSDNNSTLVMNQYSINGGAKLGLNSVDQNELYFIDRSLPDSNNCSRLKNLESTGSNIFEITILDTINYIIAGRFAFTVSNNCGDTIKITDGYFKSKFIF